MINREQFMEYYRSDKYSEELSPDDKEEVFMSSLTGSSDITRELLQKVLDGYDAGKIVELRDSANTITLDDVRFAHEHATTIESAYRKNAGQEMLYMMLADNKDRPDLFGELCDSLDIVRVSFEKFIESPDYMPDIAWYIILVARDGREFGFMYEESGDYDEYSGNFNADMKHSDDVKECFDEFDIEMSKDEAKLLWKFMMKYSSDGRARKMYDGSEGD